MKRIANYIMVAVAVCAMATGCQKENPDEIPEGSLALLTESMTDGSKTTVNANHLNWVSGDLVRINGEVCTVSVAGNTATVTSANEDGFGDGPYYGVYPSSIYTSHDGASYTVTLPRTYTYKEVNGRQNIEAPMVGYAASGNRVTFKHLTAAVDVKITNYYGFQIEVDSIQVRSEYFSLKGECIVAINGSNPSVSTAALASGTSVVSLKSDGVAKMRVDAGETGVFQIPVRPVGEGNRFKIQIYVHKVDQPDDVKKAFAKTQATGGALNRAQLAYAPVTFGGLFSVSSTKQVIISQGNLSYNKSTGVWSFQTTQYGTSETNGKVGTDYANRNIVTLFGWGTSGYNHRTGYYQPYRTGGGNSDYHAYGGSSLDFYSQTPRTADWGYNPISNGGNIGGRWRSMTNTEKTYLFNTRTNNTINGVANGRFARAKLFGTTYGIILFPDGYTHPSGVTKPANVNVTAESALEGNQYTAEDWAKMEAAGCVFLPQAGYREGETVKRYNEYGYYWTSSHSGNNSAYVIQIYSNTLNASPSNQNKYLGCAVRLIRDI